RNLEMAGVQHGNAIMQSTHQADLTGMQNQSQFANDLQMNDTKHNQTLQLGATKHDQTLQAATHGAQLGEQGKVNDFQRDSVRAAQSGEIARTNTEHAAQVQAKFPKPK